MPTWTSIMITAGRTRRKRKCSLLYSTDITFIQINLLILYTSDCHTCLNYTAMCILVYIKGNKSRYLLDSEIYFSGKRSTNIFLYLLRKSLRIDSINLLLLLCQKQAIEGKQDRHEDRSPCNTAHSISIRFV